MYDNTIKDRFVELRVAGKSFGDISQELGVVKSTLHRWEDERADDIARLRRIAWEETEAEIGLRLEEQLSGLACDIKDFQTTLDRVNRNKLSVRETLMLLRESRREYFRLRNMLMGAAPRPRSTRKISPASPQGEAPPRENNEISNVQSQISSSPASVVTSEIPSDTKSNETERSNEIEEIGSRNTNDLQQSAPQSFDSCPPAPPSGTSLNPQPPTLNQPENPAKTQPFSSQNSGVDNPALSSSPPIPGQPDFGNRGSGAIGNSGSTPPFLPRRPEHGRAAAPSAAGVGRAVPSAPLDVNVNAQSKIENPNSKIAEPLASESDFGGESIPISPFESTREWLERQGIQVSKIPKARIITTA